MIRSMTGFGRAEYIDEKRTVTVEIKTVNHRYFDITVKMPHRYAFLEEAIKAKVKESVNRGKIEVSVMVVNTGDSDVNVTLNLPLAKQYYESLSALKNEFAVDGGIDLRMLATMPDVIRNIPDIESEEEISKAILTPTEEAAKNLNAMREVEGEKLANDLLAKGDNIKNTLDIIEKRAPQVVVSYREKLRARLSELLDGTVEIPEDRILLEASIFADKCAIDEEITRLNSHLQQLKSILTKSTEPIGKKLDFLVQEMNREANTIGSKANDLEITGNMLNIKNEIEKIREQIQNIE